VSASKSNVDSWVLPAIHVATLGRLRSVIALQAQRGLDSKVSVNFCHSDRSSLELQRLSLAGLLREYLSTMARCFLHGRGVVTQVCSECCNPRSCPGMGIRKGPI
jgi:hypothetical protein